MADTDMGGGTDFTIKFDKAGLKSIQDLGKTIKTMNTGLTKLQTVLTKLQSTQAQYGKAVQKTLSAQLKVQQKMANALGVMAKGAQLQNQLMKQLISAGKKKKSYPIGPMQGPQLAQFRKMQLNFQQSVKNLYNRLPKQIQSYLVALQISLKAHLSKAWNKMSVKQQQVLTKAYGRMSKFAQQTYNNVFKLVSKGLSVATKANKIGMKIMGGAKSAWQKTGGKLAEKLPGGAGGGLLAGGMMAAATGLFVKVIQASPLLSAMMKIMQTSFTLILRPIGDFFGAFFRPLFIYFLKEVAIPFFQAGRGWMKEGEKWGHIALGFFIDPVMAIYSGAMKAISQGWGALKGLFGFEATPAWVDPATGLAEAGGPLEEIDLFQRDPAKWLRQREGIEEKTTGSAGVHMQKDNIFSKFWESLTGGLAGAGGALSALFGALFNTEAWAGTWDGITGFFGSIRDTLGQAYNWLSSGFADINRAIMNGWDWITSAFSASVQTMGSVLGNLVTWFQNAGSSFGTQFTNLIQQIWDWFASFGNAQNAVTTGIAGLGTTIWDGLTSVGETIWNGLTSIGGGIQKGIEDMVGGIKIGEIDLGAGFDAFVAMLGGAGDQLMAWLNIMTGGLIGGDTKTGTGTGTQTVSGDDAVQTGPGTYTLGGQTHYGDASDVAGKQVKVTQPIMSAAEAKAAAITSTGGSPLGDVLGNRFESSPGKFVDIYKTIGGEKVKISPTSPEGLRIQGIYQKQYEAKLRNAAQQEHTAKIRTFNAQQTQAYVMAGGGLAGMAAADAVISKNIDVSTAEGVVQLATAVPEVATNAPALVAEAKVVAKLAPTAKHDYGPGNIFGFQTPGPMMRDTSGQQPGDMRVGRFDPSFGYAQGAFGNPTVSASGQRNTGSGFGKTTVGSNRGPGGGGPGGGTGGSTSGGGSPSGNKGSAGSGRKGGGGGPGGGTTGGAGGSGGKKSGNKGSAGKGRKGRAFGGIIDEPIIGIGLHTGSEWSFGEYGDEWVTPMGGGSPGDAILNIHIGNISKEADYNKLKPLIQRWILEASSRRGSV